MYTQYISDFNYWDVYKFVINCRNHLGTGFQSCVVYKKCTQCYCNIIASYTSICVLFPFKWLCTTLISFVHTAANPKTKSKLTDLLYTTVILYYYPGNSAWTLLEKFIGIYIWLFFSTVVLLILILMQKTEQQIRKCWYMKRQLLRISKLNC